MQPDGASITLSAVGDLAIKRPRPGNVLDRVSSAIRDADVRFGNFERSLPPGFGSSTEHRCDSNCIGHALSTCGFDVMACTNNHVLNDGQAGLVAVLDFLRIHDIRAVGAGLDVESATQPVVVSVNGMTVGFLAYAAVYKRAHMPVGGGPTIATLSVETAYENVETDQPGTPPGVRTTADPAALEGLLQSIQSLRRHVDILVLSMHWGIHLVPYALADYELTVGRAAVDAGADVVLGHHQHVLKGIEVHAGKPILYGIGNLIYDPGLAIPADRRRDSLQRYLEYAPDEGPRPLGLAYPPLTRLTTVARVTFTAGQSPRVQLVPCVIDRRGRPSVVNAGSANGRRVLNYLRRANAFAGFPGQFEIESIPSGIKVIAFAL